MKSKRIFSKKHRENLSLSKIGNKAFLGHRHSNKTKNQISLSLMGHEVSSNAREKISIAHMGNKNWLGKKHSEETRKRISRALMGHLPNRGSFGIGHKPWNYKGIDGTKEHLVRTSAEYKAWRRQVFARDKFVCQKNKTRGGMLVSHHIRNFEEFPETRLSVDNGITLSEVAHIEFHKRYGRRNNTPEQLAEFLKL